MKCSWKYLLCDDNKIFPIFWKKGNGQVMKYIIELIIGKLWTCPANHPKQRIKQLSSIMETARIG